jgi:hypothetical protein
MVLSPEKAAGYPDAPGPALASDTPSFEVGELGYFAGAAGAV